MKPIWAHLAAQFKQAVTVPIITVGGIRSPKVISRILSEGIADYVAMCRPFIRVPHLINRWKSGDLKKSKCISCNGCFETASRLGRDLQSGTGPEGEKERLSLKEAVSGIGPSLLMAPSLPATLRKRAAVCTELLRICPRLLWYNT